MQLLEEVPKTLLKVFQKKVVGNPGEASKRSSERTPGQDVELTHGNKIVHAL